MNLWHEISKGKKFPEEFMTIVETPHGSSNKYEIEKETGLIALDRANYGPSAYPANYGFIPQTLWDDGDAIDVVLITTYPIQPGILVPSRPVALMRMTDSGESDDKIIAVPSGDKRWEDVRDLKDLNKHTLREFKDFWENIKNLKGEKPGDYIVTIDSYEGRDEAIKAMEKATKLYQEKFGNK